MGICNTNDSINDNPKLLKQLLRVATYYTDKFILYLIPSDSHCIPNTTPTTDTLAAFASINNNDNNNIIQYKIIVMMYYETLE